MRADMYTLMTVMNAPAVTSKLNDAGPWVGMDVDSGDRLRARWQMPLEAARQLRDRLADAIADLEHQLSEKELAAQEQESVTA